MENPCPPSLPSSTTTAAAAAAAAITTSRSSVTAAIHAPSTAAAATITTTRSNSNSGSNTDRDAGSNSGSSAAIQSSLRQLNKNSYKISKHSGDTGNHGHHIPPPLPPPSASPPLPPPPPPPPSSQQPPPQPQPPVYNIHKNDFRDVVQKLTGSPAHHSRPSAPATAGPKHAPGGGGTERGSPPPAGADLVGSERAVVVPFDLRMVDDRVFNKCYRTLRGSAPASPSAVGGGTAGGTSSRLQKIRPPPLAQLTPRPPPSLGPTADSNPFPQTSGDAGVSAAWARPSPLSPLPPLPTVSAAAESPITAYMRCLRSGAVPHQQGLIPSPRGGFSGGPLLPLAPSSPLGFGCVPSPRSACQGVLPPGLMLPPSPTPSPRWGDR